MRKALILKPPLSKIGKNINKAIIAVNVLTFIFTPHLILQNVFGVIDIFSNTLLTLFHQNLAIALKINSLYEACHIKKLLILCSPEVRINKSGSG